MLRVIAGKAKGIRLDTPEGLDTRPTLEKVREAVFGSIQFEINGSRCLDLFSGSGAMGIEALSRGAKSCVFVDNSRVCANVICANLKKTGLAGELLSMSYERALSSFEKGFDFIFIDPPYSSGYYEVALGIIKERGLLNAGGSIFAEHDGSFNTTLFRAAKEKKYGRAFVTRLCCEEKE